MVLTEKEMATIEDLHTQELSCVEKYKRYGQEAKDPVLRDLFADLEKKEQKHVESLEQVMKGSVPSCNVNDREGKEYAPKATYDSMTNPEDKKNDNFLASTLSMFNFLLQQLIILHIRMYQLLPLFLSQLTHGFLLHT